MRVLVEGSGGSAGWPEPGCRCASCLRQAAAGNVRKGSAIVVDGRLLAWGRGVAGDGTGARRVIGCGGWRTRGPGGPAAGTSPRRTGGGCSIRPGPGQRVGAGAAGGHGALRRGVPRPARRPGPARLAAGAGADHRGHGHRGGVRGSPRSLGARARPALRVLAGAAGRRRRGDRPSPFRTKRSGLSGRDPPGAGAGRGPFGQVGAGRAAARGRAGGDLRCHREPRDGRSGLGGAGGRPPGAAAGLVADGGDHRPGRACSPPPAGRC